METKEPILQRLAFIDLPRCQDFIVSSVSTFHDSQ